MEVTFVKSYLSDRNMDRKIIIFIEHISQNQQICNG